MPRCSRHGCGKEFAQDNTESCIHHPGSPLFHEGLKSWSCCNDVNKPVMEFDEFMKIPGCTEANHHTTDAAKSEVHFKAPFDSHSQASLKSRPPVPATSLPLTNSASGKEDVLPSEKIPFSMSSMPVAPIAVEEDDDLTASIPLGTPCRRNGCKATFVSDVFNRQGDGEGTVCIYHPSPPIFREGSKGYLCCKRRVLEFDEFLKISGCKKGRHFFSAPKSSSAPAEEATNCRIDHYQTLDEVHVSIFAKQAIQDRSTIIFEDTRVKLEISLPGQKRFSRVLDLFGPIEPGQSSYQFFGTKVELHLRKSDNRSWTLLEKTSHDLGNISLTFGVSGRTGTIGAKNSIP